MFTITHRRTRRTHEEPEPLSKPSLTQSGRTMSSDSQEDPDAWRFQLSPRPAADLAYGASGDSPWLSWSGWSTWSRWPRWSNLFRKHRNRLLWGGLVIVGLVALMALYLSISSYHRSQKRSATEGGRATKALHSRPRPLALQYHGEQPEYQKWPLGSRSPLEEPLAPCRTVAE